MYRILMSLFFGLVLTGGALAQTADPHAGHSMPAKPEQGDKAQSPSRSGQRDAQRSTPAKPGAWSYLGRKNPEPYTKNRWEMVPGEGNTSTYVAVDKLSREERCRALQNQNTTAIDRATRKECGMPLDPRAQEADRKRDAPGHAGMGGMNMADMDHSKMKMPGGGSTPAKEGDGMKGMEGMDHSKMPMPGMQHGEEHWLAPPAMAKRPNPIKPTRESVARGKQLYMQSCASCHGPNGEGDGPAAQALNPKPANLAVMVPQHPPGDIAWKIENGRGPMPAWKGTLNANRIWDVVNYLQSLKPAAGKKKDDGHTGHSH